MKNYQEPWKVRGEGRGLKAQFFKRKSEAKILPV